MLRLSELIILAMLVGCATEQPVLTATEDEKSAAVEAYIECLHTAAQSLDDGVSDPSTIGRAVAPLCRPELHASVEVLFREKNSRVRAMLYERQIAKENELATVAVLRLRRHMSR